MTHRLTATDTPMVRYTRTIFPSYANDPNWLSLNYHYHMPEVVKYYAQTKEIFHVREIQNRILLNYRQDFSKHISGNLLTKVNLVWDSVPAQLAKEKNSYMEC
mgnify:CR=1 FL=1